jgi:hypothetical protein
MSYELALSIAYITKRTLIIPPKTWLCFISESQEKKDYTDIWEIFDKKYIEETVDCIDFYDVPEFQGKFEEMETYSSYTGNIHNVIDDVAAILLQDSYNNDSEVHTLSDSNFIISNYKYSTQDYNYFSCNRKLINLSSFSDKFIHFENNLFGHYWYSVYPGNEIERNKMKKIINNCFRYKQKYYDISEKVNDKLLKYNAVHIRRNDFLQVRTSNLEIVSNGEKILNKLNTLFDNSLPLYISTDETNKEFFKEVKEQYDIYFYEDFNFNLTKLENTILEQIICSRAEKFYGTYLSTYSSRINVMRGLDGKQSDDDMGINHIIENCSRDLSTANPWRKRSDTKWNWNDSSHPQWKKEKNGVYVNAY